MHVRGDFQPSKGFLLKEATFSERACGRARLTCMTVSPGSMDDRCDMRGRTASGLKE